MDAQTLYSLGTILAFAGMLIIIVATALILLSRSRKTGNVKGGGAIIFGPIPIVFGTDKESLKKVLLLSTVLTALLIILIIMPHFLSKQARKTRQWQRTKQLNLLKTNSTYRRSS